MAVKVETENKQFPAVVKKKNFFLNFNFQLLAKI